MKCVMSPAAGFGVMTLTIKGDEDEVVGVGEVLLVVVLRGCRYS